MTHEQIPRVESTWTSPTTRAQGAKENGMKHGNASENQTRRRIQLIACATALAVAFAVSLSQTAHAEPVKPPRVPSSIRVPEGNTAFLEGHAVGTQNYICLPSGWTFFGPQATLFNGLDEQAETSS